MFYLCFFSVLFLLFPAVDVGAMFVQHDYAAVQICHEKDFDLNTHDIEKKGYVCHYM